MDFFVGQILLLCLLLAVIPAVTLGYLLDRRRLRRSQQPPFPIVSRYEVLALAMAWIFGAVFCWELFTQEELQISFAIFAIVLVSFSIISKMRREKLKVGSGMRWYLWLVNIMILGTFVGVIVRSEFLVILGGVALVIVIIHDRWSRRLGRPQ